MRQISRFIARCLPGRWSHQGPRLSGSRSLNRHDDVVRRFAAACRHGDIAALRAVLGAEAIALCDSGGLVPTAADAVHGAPDVAELVAVLLCGQPGTELTIEAVNGRAGLALRRGDQAAAVVAIRTAGTKVAVLWIVLNPAKLGSWHRH